MWVHLSVGPFAYRGRGGVAGYDAWWTGWKFFFGFWRDAVVLVDGGFHLGIHAAVHIFRVQLDDKDNA